MTERLMHGLMMKVWFSESRVSGFFYLALLIVLGIVLLPVWLFEYYFLGAEA